MCLIRCTWVDRYMSTDVRVFQDYTMKSIAWYTGLVQAAIRFQDIK